MEQEERLKWNLTEVLFEQQLKLGYRPGEVRLYYPVGSVQALLGSSLTGEALKAALEDWAAREEKDLGKTRVEVSRSRVCFCLASEASAYVWETHPRGTFLEALIARVREHGVGFSELRELFGSFGAYEERQTPSGRLFSFADPAIDPFIYLFDEEEPGHLSYHRYTPEDYEALKGEILGTKEEEKDGQASGGGGR